VRAEVTPLTVPVAVVTTEWPVPSSWVSAEVTGVVMLPTVLVAVVTTAWPVPRGWVRSDVTGVLMLATVPPSEVTAPWPVAASWVTAVATGAVTPETEPVTEDTEPVTEEAELVTAEVADWPAEVTWLAADFAVPAVLEVTAPAACVAADTADVAGEAGAALAGAAGLAAGALVADPESVTVETAVWAVDAAWPTADDTSAATEETLAAVAPAVPLSAVVAPGLADADADLAVRRENTMATPIAATAMPAAHRQNRRTLVTSPLVTTVTLIGPGYFCLAHLCLN
jgi:hypothetical protein